MRRLSAVAVLATLLLAACGPDKPRVTDATAVEPTLTPPSSKAVPSPVGSWSSDPERFNATPLSSPTDVRIHYRSCTEARDAGDFPRKRGRDAGYRKGLDRDGDGIACEVTP